MQQILQEIGLIPLPGHSKPSCDLETVVRSTCNRFLVPFHRFSPAHELVRVLHTCTISRAHIRTRNACTLMCMHSCSRFPLIHARARARASRGMYFLNLPSKYRGCCCRWSAVARCFSLLQYRYYVCMCARARACICVCVCVCVYVCVCVCLTIESCYVIWYSVIEERPLL